MGSIAAVPAAMTVQEKGRLMTSGHLVHALACMEGILPNHLRDAADASVHPPGLMQPGEDSGFLLTSSLMPVTYTLHCRGWDIFGWLRQEAYTGQAHYATENGEAGSAADDVREHWVRRQVRHHLTPPLQLSHSGFSPRVVSLHVLHWPLHALQHSLRHSLQNRQEIASIHLLHVG